MQKLHQWEVLETVMWFLASSGMSTLQITCPKTQSHRRSLFSGMWDTWVKSHRQILQRHVAPNKNSGMERVHFEALFKKCELLERSPCAPRFEGRSEEEASKQKRWARRAAWSLAKNVCPTLRLKPRFTILLESRQCRRLFQNHQRSEYS